MGCKSSKQAPKSKNHEGNAAAERREETPVAGASNPSEVRPSNAAEMGVAPAETTGFSAPEGRASAAYFPPNESPTGAGISAPSREPTRPISAATEVDEDGKVIALPKGTWIRAEGTPYYYSAMENLFYHPPSRQFYDPNNEMWYDSDTNEWYRDDDDESDSHHARMRAS
ncbi:unnamed protein product [Phytomonas sp. EM1]|nr:unnamed protein product [Phytomonas sp. EM1]|eukprot:CCW63109.1 unnamed protein product [Phytomonas sp. isolate EM1]